MTREEEIRERLEGYANRHLSAKAHAAFLDHVDADIRYLLEKVERLEREKAAYIRFVTLQASGIRKHMEEAAKAVAFNCDAIDGIPQLMAADKLKDDPADAD